MRSLLVLRGALGMFCLVGLCAAEAQAQPGLSAGQRSTVSGQLALGVALVRDIGGKAGAVSLSPYSVHSAVSLARIGASGATAQELDRLLGLRGGPDAEKSSLLSATLFGSAAQLLRARRSWRGLPSRLVR
jgi:hypothetical protein